MSIRGMVQIYAQTDCYNLLRVLLRASPNKIGCCNARYVCNKKNITLNNNNNNICVCVYSFLFPAGVTFVANVTTSVRVGFIAVTRLLRLVTN